MNKKRKSYFFGLFAEYWTIFLFFLKGYILLKHRYKTKFGEIDLILRKKNNIIAVEVKGRKDKTVLVGEVVSKNQLLRIKNSLMFFISKNEKYITYNLSIYIVLINNIFSLKCLKNICI